MAKGSAIHYSQEQLDFIKANCTLSRKDLTEKVNGVFGSEFSVDQIKSLCTRTNGNLDELVVLKKAQTLEYRHQRCSQTKLRKL
jgi:hypothetical protein